MRKYKAINRRFIKAIINFVAMLCLLIKQRWLEGQQRDSNK